MTREPVLPMPYEGTPKKFGRPEWDEFRERRVRALEADPSYDRRFNHPNERTARQLWRRVGWRPLSDLLPIHTWLRPDEVDALQTTAMQAAAVTLNAVLVAGLGGRLLTQNLPFDALGRGWSDNHVAAVNTNTIWDMREERGPAIWRDLMRNGIEFERLWDVARIGVPGLNEIKLVRGPKRQSYIVTVPRRG